MEKKVKQPHEVIDYDFNGDRRISSDDKIKSATITISGPDNALVQPKAVTWSDIRAKVWLAGGTNGATYKITGLVQTEGGRTYEGEFLLLVKEK